MNKCKVSEYLLVQYMLLYEDTFQAASSIEE